MLGGSTQLQKGTTYFAGDLSGIQQKNIPFWFLGLGLYKPGKKIARENTINATWAKTITLEANFADEIILSRENEKLLQAAVQQLTQQQKQVYQLSQESGMKNEEIALFLNISSLTVKNHLAAARKSIRNHFRHNAELIMIILLLNSPL